ncbi:hypothetical protein VE04_00219 [Pseudogymnoascus sp. 24MN13]|nr:hypothetical protein VE04_00219 [Pseudogymnoascus sp. 24MN13]
MSMAVTSPKVTLRCRDYQLSHLSKFAGGAERKGAWLGRLAGYLEGSRDDDRHHPRAQGIESFTTTTINSAKLVNTILPTHLIHCLQARHPKDRLQLVDRIAVVDNSLAVCAALEGLVRVAGVSSPWEGRAAVIAGGADDEGAFGVGWWLALPLDDDGAGSRGEEEDGGDCDLHVD